jgi:hypothetical protein
MVLLYQSGVVVVDVSDDWSKFAMINLSPSLDSQVGFLPLGGFYW